MKQTNSNLHRSSHPWAALATIAFTTLALAGAAQAQSSWDWINTTTSSAQAWGTAANWNPASVPSAAGVTVNFTAPIAAGQTIALASTRTVGTINLGLSGNNNRYSFSNTGNGVALRANAGNTLGTATININNNVEEVDGHTFQGTIRMEVENVVLNINSAGGRLNFSRWLIDNDGDAGRSPTMTLSAVAGAGVLQFGIPAADTTQRNQWGKLVVNQHATFRNLNGQVVSGTVDDRALGIALSSYLADAITLNGGTLQTGGDNNYNISANRGITLGALGGTLQRQTAARSWTVDSVITGTGGLTLSGAGTTTLNAANDYNGNTTIESGMLKLGASGSIANSSTIDVKSGAIFDVTAVSGYTVGASQTLKGNGTIKGATTIAGTLAAGASPGILTFENRLTLAGTTVTEIDGTAGAGLVAGHDFVNLTGIGGDGLLTYGGIMTLDIGTIFGVGTYSWNLFDFASETGGFTGISLADQYSGSLTDGGGGIWGLVDGDNTWSFTESSGVLDLTVVPVPEPSVGLLGGLGLLAILIRRRR